VESLFVIPLINELADTPTGLDQPLLRQAIDFLVLQGFDEALGLGIVVGVPGPTHADPHSIRLEPGGIGVGRLWHPTVRVMDQSRPHRSYCQRHAAGTSCEFSRQGVVEGPSATAATIGLQDHRDIDDLALEANVSHSRHPELMESPERQLRNQGGIDRKPMLGIGGPHQARFPKAQQIIVAHQAQHPLMIGHEAAPVSRMRHPAIAIRWHLQSDPWELIPSLYRWVRPRNGGLPAVIRRPAQRQRLTQARGLRRDGREHLVQQLPPGPVGPWTRASNRRKAFFRRAFPSVSWPTRRSSSARRASCVSRCPCPAKARVA
jgi:hypothetical protein